MNIEYKAFTATEAQRYTLIVHRIAKGLLVLAAATLVLVFATKFVEVVLESLHDHRHRTASMFGLVFVAIRRKVDDFSTILLIASVLAAFRLSLASSVVRTLVASAGASLSRARLLVALPLLVFVASAIFYVAVDGHNARFKYGIFWWEDNPAWTSRLILSRIDSIPHDQLTADAQALKGLFGESVDIRDGPASIALAKLGLKVPEQVAVLANLMAVQQDRLLPQEAEALSAASGLLVQLAGQTGDAGELFYCWRPENVTPWIKRLDRIEVVQDVEGVIWTIGLMCLAAIGAVATANVMVLKDLGATRQTVLDRTGLLALEYVLNGLLALPHFFFLATSAYLVLLAFAGLVDAVVPGALAQFQQFLWDMLRGSTGWRGVGRGLLPVLEVMGRILFYSTPSLVVCIGVSWFVISRSDSAVTIAPELIRLRIAAVGIDIPLPLPLKHRPIRCEYD